MGLGAGPVTEQVHADRLSAVVAQQVDPPVGHPGELERRTETMDEDYRKSHWCILAHDDNRGGPLAPPP